MYLRQRMLLIFLTVGLMLNGVGTTASRPAFAQDDPPPLPITVVDARGKTVTINSLEAIVSGSGDVTEIIVALGFEENLVGIDDSSVYPEGLLGAIPSIGFARRLTLDPIAALAPTVFFCTLTCSPTSLIDQVEQLGIPTVIVPDIVPDLPSPGLALPAQKIEIIAAALGVPDRGEQLIAKVNLEIEWAKTSVANVQEKPYIFFIYLRGRGLQLVAGEGVPSQYLIEGIGAADAGVDIGIKGYQGLSPEVILSAYPDYIILMERSVETAGGLEAVREIQGIRQTPAGQNDHFIVFDEQYLLGMATRTGQVMLDLAFQVHPTMTWEREVVYPYTWTDVTNTPIAIEASRPIVAANDDLLNITQRLGFHVTGLNELQPDALIIANPTDDWATWRAEGYTVIVVENDIPMIAAALNVPGRGTALLARLAQEP